MRLPRWSLVLLLPLAFFALLLLAGLIALVLSFAPPAMSGAALGLGALVVLWYLVTRRRSSNLVAGSESSLLGRQSSKDGLL